MLAEADIGDCERVRMVNTGDVLRFLAKTAMSALPRAFFLCLAFALALDAVAPATAASRSVGSCAFARFRRPARTSGPPTRGRRRSPPVSATSTDLSRRRRPTEIVSSARSPARSGRRTTFSIIFIVCREAIPARRPASFRERAGAPLRVRSIVARRPIPTARSERSPRRTAPRRPQRRAPPRAQDLADATRPPPVSQRAPLYSPSSPCAPTRAISSSTTSDRVSSRGSGPATTGSCANPSATAVLG